MSDEFEIRDANGRVIGCGSGDQAWARRVMADLAERGVVNPGSRATVPLRVVGGTEAAAGEAGTADRLETNPGRNYSMYPMDTDPILPPFTEDV